MHIYTHTMVYFNKNLKRKVDFRFPNKVGYLNIGSKALARSSKVILTQSPGTSTYHGNK